MDFRVASDLYAVRVAPGGVQQDGKAAMVAVLESDHEILLSADCPLDERFKQVLYALMKAWTWATGAPSTDDGWADLAATVMRSAMRDIQIGGGVEALTRMEPGEGASSGAMRITLTKERHCARCRGSVAGGSVVCKPSDLPGRVDLALFCSHCDHVMKWREYASLTGMPAGIPDGEPCFLRGKAVVDFLKANPLAAPDVVMEAT